MAAWILDDTPVDLLANVLDSKDVAAWPRDEIFIADRTARDAKGRRKSLLAGSPSPFTPFEIMIGTDAADVLYNHLRQPMGATSNLAEHQSIAWAMTERLDAVLVTVDRRACLTALAELGRGRVAHAFDLWLLLKGEGRVSQANFEKLCEATKKVDQGLPNIPRRCKAPPT